MSRSVESLRVLWIATKAPWPPIDGGRLLLWSSLRALRRLGGVDVRVTLLAPTVGRPAEEVEDARRALADVCEPELRISTLRPRLADGLLSLARRRPWTLERHRNVAVARDAARLVEHADASGDPFDLVQVEQIQALANVPIVAGGGGPLVVLRAQNVESDLWRALGRRPATPAPLRAWLRREGRLLARAESAAVRRVDATVALTDEDAARLGEMSGRPVEVVRAPFAPELPAGEPLEGDPAVVLFGSAGWAPNADGARFFLRRVWPRVAERSAGAVLHFFGDQIFGDQIFGDGAGGQGAARRVRVHPPPEESSVALARGSVLAVPLFVASGVRMKILEAWARGVPVVATPAAARGLAAEPGRQLLVAEEADEMAAAILEAGRSPRHEELVTAGREHLATHHRPESVARRLVEVWSRRLAAGRSGARVPTGGSAQSSETV